MKLKNNESSETLLVSGSRMQYDFLGYPNLDTTLAILTSTITNFHSAYETIGFEVAYLPECCKKILSK